MFLAKIRADEPHNETERSIYSNYAAIMGRAAVHYGRTVTWNEILASKFQFCPNVDQLTFESALPVNADSQGRYPVPIIDLYEKRLFRHAAVAKQTA